MFSTDEIQKRVQSQYIERLGDRLRKMRKHLVDRDWNAMKAEAQQLGDGAQKFGYTALAHEVQTAIGVLNKLNLTRTAMDQEAKTTLLMLFHRLDRFLVEEEKF